MKKVVAILSCIVLATGAYLFYDHQKASIETTSQQQQVSEKNKTEKEENKTLEYILYYKDKDMPFLFDELYTIQEDDERLKDKTIEEFIVEKLIDFKGTDYYVNPIPKGTKLLSVEKKEDMVIVNLSKEFLEGQKGNEEDTRISIASIVDSLAIREDIKKVMIQIEGKDIEKINGVDITKGFEYMPFYPDK